jgi:hypothetical protein
MKGLASDEMQSLLGVAGFADHYFSNRLGDELLDRTSKEWRIFNYENPVNRQVLQICPTSMDMMARSYQRYQPEFLIVA